MVHERDDIEGLDSSIILNRLVWKYSGHEDTFSDPLVECRECKSRFREEKLVEEHREEIARRQLSNWGDIFLSSDIIKCSNCGKIKWTEPRPFNLMFRTHVGATAEDDADALVYLRP